MAAAMAACNRLFGSPWPDPVGIRLPGGQDPCFKLEIRESGDGWARAAVRKDAGDDPDVTHKALIIATVSLASPGSGLTFLAGDGVGTVTRPGLPLPVGEPAINPAPRRMISEALSRIADIHRRRCDLSVEISVPGGEALASQTWNPRLGIQGGLSILGTPESSSRIRAPPGLHRCIWGWTWHGQTGSTTWSARPDRYRRRRPSNSTGCRIMRCSTWVTSSAGC